MPEEAAHHEDAEEPAARRASPYRTVMLPRQRVASQLKILIPVGTAITIDEIMKKAWSEVGRPTANMWWAQTSIEKKPIATVESATAL